jgi:hypothetical protein
MTSLILRRCYAVWPPQPRRRHFISLTPATAGRTKYNMKAVYLQAQVLLGPRHRFQVRGHILDKHQMSSSRRP